MIKKIAGFLGVLLLFSFDVIIGEQFSAHPHGLLGPKRTLAGAWFFNEGSGSVTRDYGNRGNAADLLSGPAWTTGLHSFALSFAAANSRAEIRNESDFDFLDVIDSTWTLVVVYWADRLLAGIVFSKTLVFSSDGFYVQAESDATGDFALVFNDTFSAGTAKWVTPVVPASQSAAKRWHVLILDCVSYGDRASQAVVNFFLDGKRLGLSSSGDFDSSAWIQNNNLAVIAGWDDGTSSSFNGRMDMVALYNGAGHGPLTEGEARAVTARLLGW